MIALDVHAVLAGQVVPAGGRRARYLPIAEHGLMSWVAVERAIPIARQRGLPAGGLYSEEIGPALISAAYNLDRELG